MGIKDYYNIGVIGLINMTLLSLISIWRTIVYLKSLGSDKRPKDFKKKLLFHIFLCLATIVDIPLYVGFIVTDGNYVNTAYAFHKFEACLLFGAYSITINDWAKVLFDINEDSFYPFIFRKYSLYIINFIYFIGSFINFAYVIYLDDINEYAESTLYESGIYIQGLSSLLITSLMLGCGLKLTFRIKGVSGPRISSGNAPLIQDKNTRDFQNALFTLNIVMFTCVLCIFLSVLCLCVNLFFGSYTSTSATIMNVYVFWTFYAWLSLWGPVLALLYLSRTPPVNNSKKKNHEITNKAKESLSFNPSYSTTAGYSIRNDLEGALTEGYYGEYTYDDSVAFSRTSTTDEDKYGDTSNN